MTTLNKLFLGSALVACMMLAGCGDTKTEPMKTTPPADNMKKDGSGGKNGAMLDPAPGGAELVLVKLELPNMT